MVNHYQSWMCVYCFSDWLSRSLRIILKSAVFTIVAELCYLLLPTNGVFENFCTSNYYLLFHFRIISSVIILQSCYPVSCDSHVVSVMLYKTSENDTSKNNSAECCVITYCTVHGIAGNSN